MSTDASTGRWRTEGADSRAIRWQRGQVPDMRDPLIGMMDTPELARAVITAHNLVWSPDGFDVSACLGGQALFRAIERASRRHALYMGRRAS